MITMRPVTVSLIGGGIGLLFAIVKALVNRGDISFWDWLLVPLFVAGLFLWLSGHFDKPKT